jgi:hypothetical protein
VDASAVAEHRIAQLNFNRVRCACGWQHKADHGLAEQSHDQLLDAFNEHVRDGKVNLN